MRAPVRLLEIQSEAWGRWPRRCGCPGAHCPARGVKQSASKRRRGQRWALGDTDLSGLGGKPGTSKGSGAGTAREGEAEQRPRQEQRTWPRGAAAGRVSEPHRSLGRASVTPPVPRQVRRVEPQARLSSHKAATGGTPRMESSGVRPPCSQGLQHRLPRGVLQRWPAVASLNTAPESAGGGRVSGAQSTAGWR